MNWQKFLFLFLVLAVVLVATGYCDTNFPDASGAIDSGSTLLVKGAGIKLAIGLFSIGMFGLYWITRRK